MLTYPGTPLAQITFCVGQQTMQRTYLSFSLCKNGVIYTSAYPDRAVFKLVNKYHSQITLHVDGAINLKDLNMQESKSLH